MKLKFVVGLALSLSISIAAFAPVAQAEPNGRPPSPVKLPGGRPAGGIVISAKENFLVDAINYAKSGSLPNGKKPALYATISIISLEPAKAAGGKTPDRTNIWYSHGQLATSGFPGAEILGGKFPLYGNFGDAPNPFSAGDNMTLGVNIERSGKASLHYQIDGRNRLGRGPQIYQFNTNEEMVLSTTDSFVGGSGQNLIRITLTKGEVLKNPPAPKPTPTPMPPVKTPIGVRYEVKARFVVTNPDDGFYDEELELQGDITLRADKTSVPSSSILKLFDKYERGEGETTADDPLIVESYFNNPATDTLQVDGKVIERDTASGNDPVWEAHVALGLSSIAKAFKGEHVIKGDGDDESGDLIITVKKIADIY